MIDVPWKFYPADRACPSLQGRWARRTASPRRYTPHPTCPEMLNTQYCPGVRLDNNICGSVENFWRCKDCRFIDIAAKASLWKSNQQFRYSVRSWRRTSVYHYRWLIWRFWVRFRVRPILEINFNSTKFVIWFWSVWFWWRPKVKFCYSGTGNSPVSRPDDLMWFSDTLLSLHYNATMWSLVYEHRSTNNKNNLFPLDSFFVINLIIQNLPGGLYQSVTTSCE